MDQIQEALDAPYQHGLKRESFNLGVLSGLVEALDVTYDAATIKKITNKIRLAAYAIMPPTPRLTSEHGDNTKEVDS